MPIRSVLILILMDITLQRSLQLNHDVSTIVLILILMDITLQPIDDYYADTSDFCFNPYFNGYYTSTLRF